MSFVDFNLQPACASQSFVRVQCCRLPFYNVIRRMTRLTLRKQWGARDEKGSLCSIAFGGYVKNRLSWLQIKFFNCFLYLVRICVHRLP